MGKQQTKHSLPHSANSVDTANELNRFYARFDVRDFTGAGIAQWLEHRTRD